MAKPSLIVHGVDVPGGQRAISSTWSPLSDDDTPCASIFIQADTTGARCYWGFDDGKYRGYIDPGAVLSITDNISPASIWIVGTTGNLYWSAKRS